jgi:phosphoribosyl 1,2-cyclic phosphate phosphodiesterase
MKLTFLGTGTSSGVPVMGCHCKVCDSSDSRDKRLRCAALLETEGTRILIDAGPDIRQQLMPFPFTPLSAVLLTHIHYDHVGGLDDLRGFCKF